MTHFRFSRIAMVFCLGLVFLHLHFSIGQDITATLPEENVSEPAEPLRIKLSVSEVRLDVVVLDNKGKPVTDLTANDFEVFQNGARQNVLSSVYIDNQSGAVMKPSAARKDVRNSPPIPIATADLKREDTHRSIIFVVDDLSMSFENGNHAKMALRNFVEKQMQAGDMVALLRTGHGNSALQTFLSSKHEVLARIEAMRMERVLSPNFDDSHLYRVYDNQLSNLSYSLRALKDMPGRKILVMMTAVPTLRKPPIKIINDPANSVIERIDFHALYNDRFNRLADDAIRAGVVVNFLNIGGLDTALIDEPLNAIDSSMNVNKLLADAMSATTSYEAAKRLLELTHPELFDKARNSSPHNVPNPLPAKTGGVLIENNNFFLDGIGKETESLMKGYYLISYVPPSDTFNPGDKEIFNKIKVNVKRKGVQVHTRDGFYNRLESDMDAAAPPAHPLQDAIFSPFTHAELNVNVAAGYAKDAKAGNLVRSWIHVDPKDVKIVETKDGGARINLEMACLTSDTNGYVQDFKFLEHTLTIEPENKSESIALIQRHGIRFAMLLPVRKSGSYYVRVAVRDKESGKTGSAYQFVEIPDTGRKGLALSNIFMIPSANDLNWLLSSTTEETGGELFFPVFQAEEVNSPALRTYAAGSNVQIMAMLYNADEKAIADSEIEMRFVLYKDGKEFLRNGRLVSPGSAGNLDGIPLFLRLTMGKDIPPGDYVLELVATDKSNSGKREGGASQAISFTVTEKPDM